VKLLIEGYYTGGGLMNNSGAGGCLFYANLSANPAHCDTMRVALVDPVTLTNDTILTGIMMTNGTISFTIPGTYTNQSYYIRLIHRNALETWSKLPVTFTSPSTTYDFTTAVNKAYGNNMVQSFDHLGWMIYSGDISDANGPGLGHHDGIVEAQDYLDMENAVSIIKGGYVYEDLTGDGVVEAADYLIMENAVSIIRSVARP